MAFNWCLGFSGLGWWDVEAVASCGHVERWWIVAGWVCVTCDHLIKVKGLADLTGCMLSHPIQGCNNVDNGAAWRKNVDQVQCPGSLGMWWVEAMEWLDVVVLGIS